MRSEIKLINQNRINKVSKTTKKTSPGCKTDEIVGDLIIVQLKQKVPFRPSRTEGENLSAQNILAEKTGGNGTSPARL